MSGGVSCNRALRMEMQKASEPAGAKFLSAAPKLCTDNAAMIAAAGYAKLLSGHNADLSLNADVHLKL